MEIEKFLTDLLSEMRLLVEENKKLSEGLKIIGSELRQLKEAYENTNAPGYTGDWG